jgi:3-deoxy-D-manno-octulosonic-acid transferase
LDGSFLYIKERPINFITIKMVILYNFLVLLYGAAIRIAALWNKKAFQWVIGRKNVFRYLEGSSRIKAQTVWFHCASLGEFEQGRPLIEAFKSCFPEYKILLTFFSPSGYEIRKNYEGADVVSYLPLDTPNNAKRFIELVQPAFAFFIKYEFWYNYLNTLNQKKIPIYVVSANFRSDQVFFKWYGGFNRSILKKVTHFFVQNANSLHLLNSIGIHQVTVSGDTRFDRVLAIAQQRKIIPLLTEFKGAHNILIAGSTWPVDHKLLFNAVSGLTNASALKLIVAPHELNPGTIDALINEFQKIGLSSIKYSEACLDNVIDARILIIDSIGILSSLYQYGELAYIGGGFGKGIHNILEAATFGLPLFFGPQHKNFQEALDLISLGGAFPVLDSVSIQKYLQNFLQNPSKLKACSKICLDYTSKHQGATNTIIEYVKTTLPHVT